jgi:hypothetical protein
MEATKAVDYDTKNHRLDVIKALKNIKRIMCQGIEPIVFKSLTRLKTNVITFLSKPKQYTMVERQSSQSQRPIVNREQIRMTIHEASKKAGRPDIVMIRLKLRSFMKGKNRKWRQILYP